MSEELWTAPLARGPVDAVVSVPGSKSMTNRALVLSALADGSSTLVRPLRSRDTLAMVGALRTLGVDVVSGAGDDGDMRVTGVPGPLHPASPARVDAAAAGTVARFVPPVAGLATAPVTVDGDPALRRRPIGPLVAALRTLGVRIDDAGAGRLPLVVRGSGSVAGGPVELDASSSSQLLSALLLAAPRFERGLRLRHVGPPLPSRPHVAMTVAMLRAAGAQVEAAGNAWTVTPGPLRAGTVGIEPDLSSAAPFLAAAAVTGGRVTVPGWPPTTTQPGALLPDLLAAMGASWARAGATMTVSGHGLRGIDVDLSAAGELTPVLAAVAVLADSPTVIRGVAHLRGHETDRLAALARELGALGAEVAQTDDGLRITPRPLHGGVFATYDDHRLAMAAAVIGLVVDGVRVVNVATTAKTLPDFADRWQQLAATC